MTTLSQGLFDVQPQWCRQPLVNKPIVWPGNRIDYNKVLFFDPTELYLRLEKRFKPFNRIQSIGMEVVWPSEKGICACGCGSKLTGRQTRWASGHNGEAVSIYNILYGSTKTIYFYLKNYYGEKCSNCGRTPKEIKDEDILPLPPWHDYWNVALLQVDHIFPVKLGGGGAWLSNYQLLCRKCHVGKTNEDFGWGQPNATIQIPLFD